MTWWGPVFVPAPLLLPAPKVVASKIIRVDFVRKERIDQ